MAKINVGKADVKPDFLAHVAGVKQGNSVGNYEQSGGHTANGKSTAARSTGVATGHHEPILPEMPNLSPP